MNKSSVYIAGIALVIAGSLIAALGLFQSATANGIMVSGPTGVLTNPGWSNLNSKGVELFVNLPLHDAPANTYDKANVPFSYRIVWAVCQNRTSYSRVIARYDLAGGLHSNIDGNSTTQWKEFHNQVAGVASCGAEYCLTSRQFTMNPGINMTDVHGDHTTLQVIAKWAWSGGIANMDSFPYNDSKHVTVTNIWLHWATPTTTPTPTVTPTTTPTTTPTATPTPTPTVEKKEPGIRVSKTDHKDITRPSHTLTYEILVENTGDKDMQDIRVTDTLPSNLIIKNIGQGGVAEGNIVRWTNISLDEDQSKTLTVMVEVKSDTKNNTSLHNVVTAKSDDHDVSDEATDDTLVKVLPQVAGIKTTPAPQPVPVSAKTGMEGAAALALSTLMGGSGLTYMIRKSLIG